MKKKSGSRVVSIIFYVLGVIVAIGAAGAYALKEKAKVKSVLSIVARVLKKIGLFSSKTVVTSKMTAATAEKCILVIAAGAAVLLIIGLICGLVARKKAKKAVAAVAVAAAPVEEAKEEAEEEAKEEPKATKSCSAVEVAFNDAVKKVKEKVNVPSKETVLDFIKKNAKDIALVAVIIAYISDLRSNAKRKKHERMVKWINTNLK